MSIALPRPHAHRPAPVPTAPGALPLFGHSLALLRDPLALLRSLTAHGDVVRLRLGAGAFYVVCTPERTRELLRDPRTFDKGGFFFTRLRELTGDNVGTCPYTDHATQRRLVQPVFRKHRMPGYARTIVEQTAVVVDEWHDGAVIDVFPDMLRIGARCAAFLVFGIAMPPTVLERTISDITTYIQGIFVRMFLPPSLIRLPLPANRRYERARRRLRESVEDMIGGRDNACSGGDLMTALLEAEPSVGECPTRTGLTDQLTLMLIAGTESTATTVSWALHELSRDRVLQDRVHAELDAVLGAESPAYHHVQHLELLGRVLTETLRKYPAAWILTRLTTSDTTFGEHPIPAGATVVYSPYLLHHRPDSFPDPDRFDPDRWLSTNPTARKSLIPFGAGTRKCAGDTFAMTEATLVLAWILTRYTVHSIPTGQVRLIPAGALQPGGLRIRLAARSATTAHPQI
ncbi:cytochrome P450 [Nocardia sp. CDC153]|uniref:cytochrome P450 n=1 Tax=Nocardia sp. CDC153 TaxID=3112167 RepID=UPI002DB9A783|nr:cytochrome P450 [Nocardia sp. CDC153]MEC3953700.1 cytochrome P450 [Nocardia sp. CDC153]